MKRYLFPALLILAGVAYITQLAIDRAHAARTRSMLAAECITDAECTAATGLEY